MTVSKKVKELPIMFNGRGEVGGYQFIQVDKTEEAYFYRVSHPQVGKVHYEVFKRKVFEPENREIYPRGESFGKWAWTTDDYEKAFEKFSHLSRQLTFPW